MLRAVRLIAAGALSSALAAACAGPARHLVLEPHGAESVDDVISRRPAEEGRNITAFLLGKTERASRHLVHIRDRERPHYHAEHDLTVLLLRGEGTIWVAGAPYAMRSGDVAVVDAGTPHYFVNQGDEPASAFVVFSPPSDGSDQVFLDTH